MNMKIRCITTKTTNIPLDILESFPHPQKSLDIDKEYVVYALSEIDQNIWYCICDKSYTYFPWWRPYFYFEIIDPRLSRYWIFSAKADAQKNQFFLTFPDWVQDSYFYGNLIEREDDTEVKIFRAYKERMDLEFPDSSIMDFAKILDDKWLMCPKCVDAWESMNSEDALIKCPKCKTIYNNPRYKNKSPSL